MEECGDGVKLNKLFINDTIATFLIDPQLQCSKMILWMRAWLQLQLEIVLLTQHRSDPSCDDDRVAGSGPSVAGTPKVIIGGHQSACCQGLTQPSPHPRNLRIHPSYDQRSV